MTFKHFTWPNKEQKITDISVITYTGYKGSKPSTFKQSYVQGYIDHLRPQNQLKVNLNL